MKMRVDPVARFFFTTVVRGAPATDLAAVCFTPTFAATLIRASHSDCAKSGMAGRKRNGDAGMIDAAGAPRVYQSKEI